MPPRYPLPLPPLLRLGWAILRKEKLSFRSEACDAARWLRPPIKVEGHEHIPNSGPCLVTINHFSRAGFYSVWLTLSVSSVVPVDIHWVISAAWTFRERPALKRLTPLSRWVFCRLSQVYSFTTMPPMPPDPADTAARARAVRRVLETIRCTPGGVIGLAPEGQDSPDGVLQRPHPGVGRFLTLLADAGLRFLPVGIFEENNALHLRFGPGYRLEAPPGLSAEQRDLQASQIVMKAIACQLPPHMRGEFG
ncbi:MAG: hypothetical protein EHM70_10475 [Chloroflexota bacterium]|nr:MAG: hypothetical protein EHM70_10475 [Chloroflexota bacterium]